MRGVFLNQLALSQHGSGLWKVKLSSSAQESYGDLVNQLKNYRANRDKILDYAQFLDMVSGLKQELSFSELLKQLISWEFTNPEKNYHKEKSQIMSEKVRIQLLLKAANWDLSVNCLLYCYCPLLNPVIAALPLNVTSSTVKFKVHFHFL